MYAKINKQMVVGKLIVALLYVISRYVDVCNINQTRAADLKRLLLTFVSLHFAYECFG